MTSLLRAEIRATWSTRTVRIIGATVLFAAVILLPAVVRDLDERGTVGVRGLIGLPSGVLTLAVLLIGVLVVTSEFRHGTVVTTYLVTPARHRVIVAKVAAAAVAGVALALIASALVLVGIPLLAATRVEMDLFTAEVAYRFGAMLLAVVLYSAIAVGLGALMLNQTAAVAVVVASETAVEALFYLLGLEELYRWWPSAAARSLFYAWGAEPGALPMLSAGTGGVVFAAWAAAVLAMGILRQRRLDVG